MNSIYITIVGAHLFSAATQLEKKQVKSKHGFKKPPF